MTDPETPIERILQDHISASYLNGASVAVDEDLLLSGLLDSLGVMSLVAFIEERFDCSVPFEDVLIENFNAISNIAAYVRTRVASHA